MLDRTLTEFLEQGLAVHIGTRDARMEPNGCRVTAVRVEDQGRQLIAYLPKAATPAVLADLRDNGQAALSFARPSDDRAVQVKGEFIDSRDADESEQAFVLGQLDGLLRQLEMVGIPAKASSTWKLWPCIVVRIRVTAIFSQTPGPDAGAVLS
jgi:hypothetical protein